MSNIQAAMGCAQLLRISELVCKRQETLASYKKELLPLGNVSMNPDQEGCENGAWMPTVVIRGSESIFQEILKNLRVGGIDARPFFAPLSQMGLFPKLTLSPNSAQLAKFGLNLPSYQDMTRDELCFVTNYLRRLVD